MTPIKVHVVRRAEIERLCGKPPIPTNDLQQYLALRPGILDDNFTDIFCPNIRSRHQRWHDFGLWEHVDHFDAADAVVFPCWLELFEAFGCRQKIATCINWMKDCFSSKKCVIQWNHDRDGANVPELQNLPSNFFVIQFNTSRPTPNDILVPFWTIETRIDWEAKDDRVYSGGFIGYVGGVNVRARMKAAFTGKKDWFIVDTTQVKSSESVYISHMKQFDFALCPRGGGLSSYRFFEAIQCGAIPILFADDVALPYPDLPWGDLICRIPECDAANFDLVWDLVGNINVKERRLMLQEARERCSLLGVQEEAHKRLSQ